MRHPVKKPEKRGSLECPCNREPLAFELNRENEGDEEQRNAAEPCELVEPLRVVGGHRA